MIPLVCLFTSLRLRSLNAKRSLEILLETSKVVCNKFCVAVRKVLIFTEFVQLVGGGKMRISFLARFGLTDLCTLLNQPLRLGRLRRQLARVTGVAAAPWCLRRTIA